MLQVFSSLATGIGTSETGNTGVLKREKFMNCKKKKKKKSGLIERVGYIGLSGCGVINTLQSFFFFLVSLQRRRVAAVCGPISHKLYSESIES